MRTLAVWAGIGALAVAAWAIAGAVIAILAAMLRSV